MPRLGAVGVLILPESPMDWVAVREACAEARLLVALSAPRQIEAAREAGLIVVEVDPTDAAITERITLALIQAVADDQLKAGARVVVVYSGFEAAFGTSIRPISPVTNPKNASRGTSRTSAHA